jgi:cytochrome c oxidase subunit 2
LIFASVLVVIVSAIVAVALLNMQMFQPAASTQAGPIDQLFNAMLVVIAVLFALIVVFMVYSVIAFRRRADDDGDGVHFHGNTRLEIAWTVLPLITVLIFGTWGAQALAEITAVEPDALEIEVVAQRYAWQFNYPEQGVKPPINQAVVPVDQPVVFKITSIDVIHDFWVPEFRVKQDAVPGLIRELRITPNRVGEYKVRCDELCGILHHDMLANIRVAEQNEFDTWVSELQSEAAAQAEAEAQLGEAAARGAELSVSIGCTACHNITGEEGGIGPTWKGLFDSEVPLADGSSVAADDDYILSSIINPNGQLHAGYPQGVMPQNYGDQLSEEQLADIVEYIKSLGGE